MSITVTEKEYWKNRLELRINRKIDSLVASTNPKFLIQVSRESKQEVKKSLGIEKILTEAEELAAASKKLSEKSDKLIHDALRIAKGNPKSTTEPGYPHIWKNDLDRLVSARAETLRTSIMEQTVLGSQILRLESEREQLLDTIWLATSPKQMKELWESLGTLLEESPTALQEQAPKSSPEQ